MKKIDLNNYPRKDHFEFFRTFDEPLWGLTLDLDCTFAYQYCKKESVSFYAFYLYRTLQAANDTKELKYRIIDDDIYEVDFVSASATILRDDHTFGFSLIRFDNDFNTFTENIRKETERVKNQRGLVMQNDIDVIHISVIPWVRFTALSHARSFHYKDSIPKISYGKLHDDGDQLLMPVSLHVNHALVDGYHAGQFIDRFESLMNTPW